MTIRDNSLIKIARVLSLRRFTEFKLFRFITVGFLNTLFGYTAYAALVLIGFQYYIALLLANIFGILFNYFNFGKFVFSGHRDRFSFFKTLAVYSIIYSMNAVGLRVLMQDFQLDPYLGQFICAVPSVLLSWFLMNYWVFRR